MLKARGFGPKWIKLIYNILDSASTLVNGVPGKRIICKRGVRQGDPLSPILFVNTFDLLQSDINKAWQNGYIDLPIMDDVGQKYPIVQYADDTLMIMPADNQQLIYLKEVLQIFSQSAGLHVNFHKTTLVPINIDIERGNDLADIFGCEVESLPFAYLGLPLGTTRPFVSDLMPTVSIIDKKLSGISSLMSYTGKLTLLNSVIQSLPMYAMCSFKVPITIFVHFEKSGRRFLWYDRENKIQGKCLASWEMMCRPKDQGFRNIESQTTKSSSAYKEFAQIL
jgi:hypothetical protein